MTSCLPLKHLTSSHSFLSASLGMFLLFGGCSQKVNAPQTGSVHGTVKLHGQPLQSAIVTFENPSRGFLSSCEIRSDGSYVVPESLQIGEYIVWVSSKNKNPQLITDARPNPTADDSTIPKKYRSVKTSELTIAVGPGANEFNLDLTD